MKKILPLQIILVSLAILFPELKAQVSTVSSDTRWKDNQAVLSNTMEAGFIIRIGDVDNLGFGWPEGFDPFCGHMTDSPIYR